MTMTEKLLVIRHMIENDQIRFDANCLRKLRGANLVGETIYIK